LSTFIQRLTLRASMGMVACLLPAAPLLGEQSDVPQSISLTAPPLEPGSVQRRTIPRVSRPPRLEDFLNGTPREAELVISDLRQYGPVAGAPVSTPTTAYLSYDGENIYAGFIVKDDPALIRAHLVKRDKLDPEDRISIGLDTFNDHRRCYWFDVNPYGCQQDGMTIEGTDDYNFDAVYKSEARLTGDGYVALISIPFKSLRFPNKPIQEWSFNVCRLITRNNEIASWPYISPDILGWAAQFARLDGIEGVTQGRNIQLVPYAMYSDARYLDEPEVGDPSFVRSREGRVGLDAKMIIRDALTLDATIRPDFSQVESDAPQVTVNQRYEVVYPEKRPFFMENANLFQSPTQLFFSRRIVDPSVGARLTGKLGPWSIGVLGTDDKAPTEENRDHSDRETILDHRAGIGVMRVSREFGKDNRLGMLVTNRTLGQGYNRVFALDGRYRLFSNWVAEGQWMKSQTELLNGERFEGGAGKGQLTWTNRNVYYSLQHEDRSPDFRADLGYLDRVDIRRTTQFVNYMWRPDKGNLLSYGPTLWGSYITDRTGLRQNWEILPGFEVELARQTRFRVQHFEGFERYDGLEFRNHSSQVSASSDFFPWLGGSFLYNQGTGINYSPAADLRPFLGRGRYMTAGFTLKPGIHLSVENTFIYSQLRTSSESGITGVETGTDIFINRILRSKWNYQFTREFSLRAIFDYHTLDPDRRLMDPDIEKDRRFGVDVLFTYFLHPGTAIYIGYTDLCRNLSYDPTRNPILQRTDGIGLSAQELIYVKASFLIRP